VRIWIRTVLGGRQTMPASTRPIHTLRAPRSPSPTPARINPYADKEDGMSTATPEQVLESIVTGINSGNLESLMPLYESEAAFATQPGSLAPGALGVREALTGFISMKGKLDLEVTRVLEAGDLALVVGVWSFNGTGPNGEPVRLASRNADVLRRQTDGTWRFVIDNPWGTD
jgi:ketosteroid isomerase-like protein